MPASPSARAEASLPSQRILLPLPPPSWPEQVYTALLAAAGLRRRANRLALDHCPVSNAAHLLHAGCGNGLLTVALKHRHPALEIEACDSSESLLELAVERAARAKVEVLFMKGYPLGLPSTAERHDVVLTVLQLGRFDEAPRKEAFAEYRRVLRPGGSLVLVEPAGRTSGCGGRLVRRLSRCQPGLARMLHSGLAEVCRAGGFSDPRILAEGPFGLQVVAAQ
jgi:ubiquinone/menaquinone biosynthesis C-methylase UbiE